VIATVGTGESDVDAEVSGKGLCRSVFHLHGEGKLPAREDAGDGAGGIQCESWASVPLASSSVRCLSHRWQKCCAIAAATVPPANCAVGDFSVELHSRENGGAASRASRCVTHDRSKLRSTVGALS